MSASQLHVPIKVKCLKIKENFVIILRKLKCNLVFIANNIKQDPSTT